MSKLTREDKIKIYERRKNGETIPSLAKAFNVQESNIKYLIALIKKHGYNILREDKNRVYSKDFKLQTINRILINHESINSVAINIGLAPSDILHNWLSKFKENENYENLIFHSDQGWQYQHYSYQEKLKEKKITQSMSRKGNSLDNGLMECFFGLLKLEMFYEQEEKYKTLEELKEAIEDYIYYYNNKRIKEKLKGLTPASYRSQSLLVS